MPGDQLFPARLCAVAYAAAPVQLDTFARRMGAANWTAYTWGLQFHAEEACEGCGLYAAPIDGIHYLILMGLDGSLPSSETRFQLSVCHQAPEEEMFVLEVEEGRALRVMDLLK